MSAPLEKKGANPSDWIWALVCGYPKAIRKNRLLLMLRAFIDDSNMGQPPAYVLAGWIASAELWAKFSEDWAAICAMRPRIDYFKFNEAIGRAGQFAGFSEAARNEKVALLRKACIDHDLDGIAVVVPHDIFKQYFVHFLKKNQIGPYFVSFYLMMKGLMQYCDEREINTGVSAVFDQQPGQMKNVLSAWIEFVKHTPPEFARFIQTSPIFANDKDMVALQAADFLAGWIRTVESAKLVGAPAPNPPWGATVYGGDLKIRQLVMDESLAKELRGPIKIKFSTLHPKDRRLKPRDDG